MNDIKVRNVIKVLIEVLVFTEWHINQDLTRGDVIKTQPHLH
jgi:hypothetical protein